VDRRLGAGYSAFGIETALIDPGKPWQNGALESFNGKFRDECLNMEWFRSRGEAKVVIEAWRRHFNEVRPHSSLGYLTPAAFAAKLQKTNAAPASATGRSAARCGAPRPGPLQHRPLRDNQKTRRRQFFQLNRGPKNQGRSDTPNIEPKFHDLRSFVRAYLLRGQGD
jgi:putative transposase